jgi:NTE family protein
VAETPTPRGTSESADALEAELDDDRQLRGTPPLVDYGLALSGGGIRATLFHLGAIWRINELGRLRSIGRITSVSGGSIASGLLAIAWPDLQWDAKDRATNLGELFAKPVLRLARMPLDIPIVAIGLVPGIQPSNVLSRAFDAYFFHGATLQDLPADGEGPRFVFNATELSSGTDWRLSRPYMGSYRIGLIHHPTVRLADAVAASASFPPLVSPLVLTFDPDDLEATDGADLHDEIAAEGRVALTDGGAYDNMGLAPILRRCRTLLVSDAGGGLGVERNIAKWQFWSFQLLRTLNIAVSQERGQRRRSLIVNATKDRPVGYWRTLTDPAAAAFKNTPMPFPIHPDWRVYLAGRPTQLRPFPIDDRHRLVNWGYVVSDVVLRTYIWTDAPAPRRLPFPDADFADGPGSVPDLGGTI